MDQGGKLPCPWCKKGLISKESRAVYRCDNCRKAIVGRVKLELPKTEFLLEEAMNNRFEDTDCFSDELTDRELLNVIHEWIDKHA